jgi:hypothetical protein
MKSLLKILGAIGKYSAVAATAVQEAEALGGPGATKKQVAVALTVAGVHAGQSVGVPEVTAAAEAVELAFGIASLLGSFGAPKPGAMVAVPAADPPAAAQSVGGAS